MTNVACVASTGCGDVNPCSEKELARKVEFWPGKNPMASL